MSIQDVHRLSEERDEAQIALEEACRETFLPGMTIAYGRGGKEVIALLVAQDDEADYKCIVRNPKTGTQRTILYEHITRIIDTQKTPATSIEAARKHHEEHGDMDGHTCLLSACALHYPLSSD